MPQTEKLTIKQVARELEVDERTVRRWIKSGELPYAGFDIRGRYLIARSALDEFVRRRTEGRGSDE
jgi:excisionase family DNA binding protein